MAEDILKKTITVADLQKLVSAWDGATGDDRVNYVGTDWADQITKAVAVLKSNKFYNAPPDTFITVEQLFAGAPQSVQQKFERYVDSAL